MHTSEDTTGFPALGEQFPSYPILEELQEDHRLIADIAPRLQELLTTLTPDNAEQVRRSSTADRILESHFQWEERRLVDAFDALRTAEGGEDLFGPIIRRNPSTAGRSPTASRSAVPPWDDREKEPARPR